MRYKAEDGVLMLVSVVPQRFVFGRSLTQCKPLFQLQGMDRSQKEEKWLAREIQLSQKHAELLAKREKLLHLSQSELNSSEHKAKVHQAHWTHVQQRNKQLLQDIKRSQVEMKDISRQPPNVKFTELQTMYWTTVQDQLPQWKKQMKEKGQTINSPYH